MPECSALSYLCVQVVPFTFAIHANYGFGQSKPWMREGLLTAH